MTAVFNVTSQNEEEVDLKLVEEELRIEWCSFDFSRYSLLIGTSTFHVAGCLAGRGSPKISWSGERSEIAGS